MKNLKKRLLSMVLATVMALGLAAPALAAGSTFSDVPESHWAYDDVETAAAEGLMKGTGGDLFSPDMKVSVAQFLTLVGRVVFPDVKAEGEDWSGPYVNKAQEAGLLTGTQVNVNDVEAEISRYDMAVILRAAAKQLGVTEKAAQQSEVADYGVIPNMYTDAVLAVYGMGLIKGDQAGNFNGSKTMMRSEVVTVLVRLFKLKPNSGVSSQPTDPEKPDETERPTESVEDQMAKYRIRGSAQKTDHAIGRPVDDEHTYLNGTPLKLYYTTDGGKTSTLVAETVTDSDSIASYDISFEAPKSWGNFENGNGFYFSAEAEVDGQRLVTSDLRTDGRAYKDLFRITPNKEELGWVDVYDVEFTPPDGEKSRFTYRGKVIVNWGRFLCPTLLVFDILPPVGLVPAGALCYDGNSQPH